MLTIKLSVWLNFVDSLLWVEKIAEENFIFNHLTDVESIHIRDLLRASS